MPITLSIPGGRRGHPRAGEIDRHVGARIRQRRVMLGFSQHHVAELVGCSAQQMHKYEKGVNRTSPSALYALAAGLSVEVNYFFEGFGNGAVVDLKPYQQPATRLIRDYVRLDEREQQAVRQLARSLLPDDGGEGA